MRTFNSSERLRVNVIVPLYNEEASFPLLARSLAALHDRLNRFCLVTYVLVDDGSTDDTLQLARNFSLEGGTCSLLVHDRNQGLGAALRTGFKVSGAADIVCTVDADCTYAPEHLEAMIRRVQANETDILVASPYHPDGSVEGVQRWRLLLSTQCSRLYRLVSPLKLYTYTSLFRVYCGEFVAQQPAFGNDFLSLVELVLAASARGYRIAEFPLTLRRRSAGVSKMKIAATIRAHAILMWHCLLRTSRGSQAPASTRRTHIAQQTIPLNSPGTSEQ